MLRLADCRAHRSRLDRPALIYICHGDAGLHLDRDANAVRNEQHRHAELPLDPPHKPQALNLNGRIRRFVGSSAILLESEHCADAARGYTLGLETNGFAAWRVR